jgi:sulfonate transport system permease protein
MSSTTDAAEASAPTKLVAAPGSLSTAAETVGPLGPDGREVAADRAGTDMAGRPPTAAPVPGDLEVVVDSDRVARRRRVSHRWFGLAIPVLVIAAWQVASSSGALPPLVLPSPETVLRTFCSLVASGTLQSNLAVSLERALIGLAIGVSAGTVLALVAGLSRIGDGFVDAPMQMARTLPVLALVPLFIVWFGIGELSKDLLIAYGVTFPVYLNLYAGIRSVDPKLLEAGKVLGLDRKGQIRHVVIPGALPGALVGLRYAIGIAWLLLVISEQINANSGIGYLMNNAREYLRTDIIMDGLIVYAGLGLFSDYVVRRLERRLLAWRGDSPR